MVPVVENVFGSDPYATPATVPYLHVESLSVVTVSVVLVVPDGNDPWGPAADIIGGS